MTRTDQEAGESARRLGAWLLLPASILLGGGSLVLFCFFLLFGPPLPLELGLAPSAALPFDAALSVLFFLQHSTMTRPAVRVRVSRWLPGELYGALFASVSGACLLLVLILWQESPPTLFRAEGLLRGSLRLVFGLALVGFVWGERSLPLDTLGLRDVVRYSRRRPAPPAPFTVRGPYRWVRHPLYFFSLVLFWARPELTADRLLFNGLWTLWVLLGALLEERDLVGRFGAGYVEYQRRVPMLLPYKLRPSFPAPSGPPPQTAQRHRS